MTDTREWQDMATAPRDGTEILGFWSYLYEGDDDITCGMQVVSWDEYPDDIGSGWSDRDGIASEGVYKFWMPLPPAPQEKGR